MESVAIVTSLILIQYLVFGGLAGWARGKSGVKAPATTGDPRFERFFRVHYNTLEQVVAVVPGLWLFGWYLHAEIAAALGLVYLIARTLYCRAYVRDPSTRGPSFAVGLLVAVVLLAGGLIGAVLKWI
jgi:glutathione S-transferase